MPRAVKPQEIKTPGEAFSKLASSLRLQATRPNIYGYKPHDKQVAFHSSQAKGRLYIGGNRSGKTTGGIAEDIMWLTGKHPYRVTPQAPVAGRIVSVDFLNGIEKIIRPELARWLPPSELLGGSWATAYNKELRTLTLENGSFVEFMSYDQDLDKFAGTSRDFIHFDEEPPQDIWLENKTRLIDRGGSYWITMTPVEGMCVDEQTQLLSQRGWLYYHELSPDEIILTHLGWRRLNAIYINNEYSGPTHTFGGLDAVATSGHKWMTQRGLVPENEIVSQDKIKISVDIDSMFPSQHSKEFCELLGWVVGDGTIPNDSSTKVIIYQSEKIYPENCQRIKDLIEFCGGAWYERERYVGDGNLVIGINGELGRAIRAVVGNNKVVKPEWVAGLNKQLLKAFEAGLVGSDGTVKTSGTREITTIRRDHADMYEMVGVLAGYRVTTGTYKIPGRNSTCYKIRYWAKEQRPSGGNKKMSWYEGTVWCPNTEAGTFIARRNGSIYLTGNTWVFDDIYMPGKSDPSTGISVVEVDMTENPYLHSGEVDEFVSGLSSDDREARVHGKFVQLGGLIFKHFDPAVHVIDPISPPKDWEWYASLDHGYNNPTAWLWHAVSPDNRVITFAEHYLSGEVVDYHAGAVHKINEQNGRPPDVYVGDPSIRNSDPITGTSIHLEYSKNGVPILLGNNDVPAGLNRMARYLEVRGDGKPSWLITRNCSHLIYEMQRYRWKTFASKKMMRDNNGREAPHKKEDHAVDSARYFFMARPELGPNNHTVAPVKNPLGLPEVKFDRFAGEEFPKRMSTEWSVETQDEFMGIW